MNADWTLIAPDLQVALSREALSRARRLVGAQAEMLAEQMSCGSLPPLDGPDALRLLAMILAQEPSAPKVRRRAATRRGHDAPAPAAR